MARKMPQDVVPVDKKRGKEPQMSDLATEAALTMRMVFRLPLRQTEGFLRSLVELLGLGLPIPDHTTLSRRLQGLGTLRSRELAGDDPSHAPTPIRTPWAGPSNDESGGARIESPLNGAG
jgi:hypothetical protein